MHPNALKKVDVKTLPTTQLNQRIDKLRSKIVRNVGVGSKMTPAEKSAAQRQLQAMQRERTQRKIDSGELAHWGDARESKAQAAARARGELARAKASPNPSRGGANATPALTKAGDFAGVPAGIPRTPELEKAMNAMLDAPIGSKRMEKAQRRLKDVVKRARRPSKGGPDDQPRAPKGTSNGGQWIKG